MNRVVVVVGGTSGIGKGVVDAFRDQGDKVFSIGRKNCNIVNKEEIDVYFDKFDNIDVLINNAAINYCKTINEISLEEWNQVLSTNLTSYFYILFF